MVEGVGEERGVDVRRLVEKDFTDQSRRGNAEVLGLPAAPDLLRVTGDGENTDLPGSLTKERRQACGVKSFAQRETHRDLRQTKAESDMVINALQLDLCRSTPQPEPHVVLQSATHGANAPRTGAQIDEHEGVSRIGGKPV